MRWVLMTPFGYPVEPEVNRNLAMVSGPTLAWAASTAAVGSVITRSANGVVGRLPSGLAAVDNLGADRHGGIDGAGERLAVGGINQARASASRRST